MSNYISNFKYQKNTNTTSFDITNKKNKPLVLPSFNSALRRVMLSEIPCIAADRDSVVFTDNDTVYNNDMVTHRLHLVPIIYSNEILSSIDNIKLVLKIENTDDDILNVFMTDFKVMDTEKNIEIDHAKIFVNPDILFLQLKSNWKIEFEGKLATNTALNKSVEFSHMCLTDTVVKFKNDTPALKHVMKQLNLNAEEQIRFSNINASRYYLKMSETDDTPSAYTFKVSTVGSINNKTAFASSLDILNTKLVNVIDALNNNDESIVIMSQSDTTFTSFDFKFLNETDTIGALLHSYLSIDNRVNYAGYYIPHPLDTILILRMSMKNENNNTLNINKDILIQVIKSIQALITNFKSECNKKIK
jgi:DNA-directed RNA polymerase subunit L